MRGRGDARRSRPPCSEAHQAAGYLRSSADSAERWVRVFGSEALFPSAAGGSPGRFADRGGRCSPPSVTGREACESVSVPSLSGRRRDRARPGAPRARRRVFRRGPVRLAPNSIEHRPLVPEPASSGHPRARRSDAGAASAALDASSASALGLRLHAGRARLEARRPRRGAFDVFEADRGDREAGRGT